MRKRFTITENDAGTEAFRDEYVHGLRAALSLFTGLDEWWLQLHEDGCPSHGAGDYHPDDCPPELECNCGGDARMRQVCDAQE